MKILKLICAACILCCAVAAKAQPATPTPSAAPATPATLEVPPLPVTTVPATPAPMNLPASPVEQLAPASGAQMAAPSSPAPMALPASPAALESPATAAVVESPASATTMEQPASGAAMEKPASETGFFVPMEKLEGYGGANTLDLGISLMAETGWASGDFKMDSADLELDAGWFIRDHWRLLIAPSFRRSAESNANTSSEDNELGIGAGFEYVINNDEFLRYYAGARFRYSWQWSDRTGPDETTLEGMGMSVRLGANILREMGLLRLFLFATIKFTDNDEMSKSSFRGGLGASWFFFWE